MLKGQRKVNIAGSASGLGLLLLAFLLVNPLGSLSVSALEVSRDETDSVETGEPVAQADTNESRVEISFTPTEVSGEMTPTTAAGLKKQLEAMVTVTIQNAEDYTIYIGAKTTGLVGVNSGEVIESIKSAISYEDLAANSWGIYYGEGTTVPANATYLPVETGRGMRMDAGGRTTSTLTKTYALGFAANINNQVPADTYENQITLSVVSSPLEVVGLSSITNMQDMTSAVCEVSEVGEEVQLKDIRDGKYYWVSKLADGKCWMTQNLDLDLSTSIALTPEDSDVATNWVPEYTTATVANSSTILTDNTGQRSWSLGNYMISNPTISSDCGSAKNSAANCPNQFTAHDTPVSANGDIDAHYMLGNHYQWNTATAGTGGTITSGQASGSICPRGWRLPESNSIAVGSFGGLVNAYNIGTDAAKMASAPLYFVRGGGVGQGASYLFENGGSSGYYWSSTPASTVDLVYYLAFYGSANVYPSRTNNLRRLGHSVRCLAR